MQRVIRIKPRRQPFQSCFISVLSQTVPVSELIKELLKKANKLHHLISWQLVLYKKSLPVDNRHLEATKNNLRLPHYVGLVIRARLGDRALSKFLSQAIISIKATSFYSLSPCLLWPFPPLDAMKEQKFVKPLCYIIHIAGFNRATWIEHIKVSSSSYLAVYCAPLNMYTEIFSNIRWPWTQTQDKL